MLTGKTSSTQTRAPRLCCCHQTSKTTLCFQGTSETRGDDFLLVKIGHKEISETFFFKKKEFFFCAIIKTYARKKKLIKKAMNSFPGKDSEFCMNSLPGKDLEFQNCLSCHVNFFVIKICIQDGIILFWNMNLIVFKDFGQNAKINQVIPIHKTNQHIF